MVKNAPPSQNLTNTGQAIRVLSNGLTCLKNQGWLKFTVRRTEGGGLKYYLFEKFRAYLFKNIKNS